MSTSKYIRPMGFGELVGSTLRIYLKILGSVWLVYLLIHFGLYLLMLIAPVIDVPVTSVIADFLIYGDLIFFPALFIGPVTLTISNIILGRPKRTWTSIRKGMSLSMILKIFLFFSPVLVIMLLLLFQGTNPIDDFGTFYLLFTVPLVLLFPLWVFYPIALLLEKKNILQSVGRTMTLISGQFKRLLVIQIFLLIVVVLLTPLGLSFQSALYPDSGGSFLDLINKLMDYVSSGYLMSFFSEVLFASLNSLIFVMPLFFGFAITMYILHYYQVRAIKENYNEELLAQELGYQPIEEMMTV